MNRSNWSLGDLSGELPDKLRGDHSCHPIHRVTLWVELHHISANNIALQILEDVEHIAEREASWLNVRDTGSKCRVKAVHIN